MSWSSKGNGSFKRRKRTGLYVASNNTFDPKTCQAHSYDWWRYVDKIKGVVFNNHSYSVSTSRHQSNMRSLLDARGITIGLEVDMRESLTSFNTAALPSLYTKLFRAEIALARKGAREKAIDDARDSITEAKVGIKLARKLGAKMSREAIAELKAALFGAEIQRLERMRNEANARRVVAKQARALAKAGTVIDLDTLGAA